MALQIGRFEIRRELGRGAQSIVYLAYDPQLQREIAIKTLHFSHPDAKQNQALLAEARTVSQLRHANIVPIFEANEEDGDLYLVFEYVPGKSLAQHLKDAGPLSPVRAITLMRSVLDAMACAHENGIIHRDLKPSNILLDEDGIPQVMDFGIAARVEAEQHGGEGFTGTPAYMAPEYISHHVVDARADIFAAGLVLFEMLTGRRAVQGNDVYQVMRRIVDEDVRLPADVTLDERIVDILYKATARLPEKRYESVAQFRQALDAYLEPEEEGGDKSGGGKQSTLEFLLRRMRHKSDFPALSESVSAINKIATSETESIARLSTTILKDFALTNKILRLVNSAYYRQAGGGNISTVSRAVIVLGFDAVRNIAITVLLFEHLQNKSNAAQLKDEFLRANLAGILAKDIGAKISARDVEQAFICSMFHNLGRLLCQYYFPEESEEVKRIMAQKEVSEESASLQVLGMSYEDLGIGVARTWGFPNLIVNSMRKLPAGNVRVPNTPEEKLRVISAFSNELCTVIAQATQEERARELKKVTARFGASVRLEERELRDTIDGSIVQVKEFASIIRLNLQQTPFGRQLRVWAGDRAGAGESGEFGEGGTQSSLDGTMLVERPDSGLPPETGVAEGEAPDSATAQAILTSGIQDISNTLVEDYKLNDILRIILETMYRAMGFKRVVLCIKDARGNAMQGRIGYGPDAAELAQHFRFPLSFTPDIFHAAISKGVDILISDTNDAKIKARIPDWFRKSISSETFVLFPLTIKGNPVAMIYADKDKAGDIVIPEKELSLLRTLRNQALLAIKQAA
ncbi:MAG TPA: HDOD domain-containing protein [Azospira sp.]|nr:HDOD domain-containing protein [Azospira sp.]